MRGNVRGRTSLHLPISCALSVRNKQALQITAPAKLNLGLEVIGRRSDGYHDLATIFLAVDLCDRLTLTPAADLGLTCSDPALQHDDNLILRALHTLREETGAQQGARIDLQKRIPRAAGLGGASTDAAAALLAARDLWRLGLPDERLAAIGARLGSDVPFFLRGGCAAGRGRGDVLEPLPVPRDVWFVIVAPAIVLPNKTASLYARLQPGDFSPGGRISAQAARLQAGLAPDPALLSNAFARALYDLHPPLAALPDLMRAAGAASVAITGAGPAHYALVSDPEEAKRIAATLRDRLREGDRVFVAAPVSELPQPEAL